ncbi:hypothetical protein LSI54_12840 [Nesterenkonia sp. AY15]|uniref:hypothetical protein n=1 Tax=Nesterenkonia sp. AY15 TaxID=2901139 RepID=UPI001F4C5D78|nr:hypothetical protein [Nesterenkonia sp. AY15]MCH8572234.1 hypothetical protein [Nesterenkonia sp. AY15]
MNQEYAADQARQMAWKYEKEVLSTLASTTVPTRSRRELLVDLGLALAEYAPTDRILESAPPVAPGHVHMTCSGVVKEPSKAIQEAVFRLSLNATASIGPHLTVGQIERAGRARDAALSAGSNELLLSRRINPDQIRRYYWRDHIQKALDTLLLLPAEGRVFEASLERVLSVVGFTRAGEGYELNDPEEARIMGEFTAADLGEEYSPTALRKRASDNAGRLWEVRAMTIAWASATTRKDGGGPTEEFGADGSRSRSIGARARKKAEDEEKAEAERVRAEKEKKAEAAKKERSVEIARQARARLDARLSSLNLEPDSSEEKDLHYGG